MAALVAVIPKQQLNMAAVLRAAGAVAVLDMQSTNYSDLLFSAQNVRIFLNKCLGSYIPGTQLIGTLHCDTVLCKI